MTHENKVALPWYLYCHYVVIVMRKKRKRTTTSTTTTKTTTVITVITQRKLNYDWLNNFHMGGGVGCGGMLGGGGQCYCLVVYGIIIYVWKY